MGADALVIRRCVIRLYHIAAVLPAPLLLVVDVLVVLVALGS